MVNKKYVPMQHASRLAAIPHNSLFPLFYDKNVIEASQSLFCLCVSVATLMSPRLWSEFY